MTTSLKRLAGLLMFVALPLALIALAALNLLDGLETRDATQLQASLQARLQARLTAIGESNDPTAPQSLTLGGANGALAGAELRQRVVDAIAAVNGRLIETRAGDPDPERPAEEGWISLSASFVVGNDALASMLRTFETGVPLLVVDALSLRRDEEAAQESGNPLLRVDLTLRGARQIEAP